MSHAYIAFIKTERSQTQRLAPRLLLFTTATSFTVPRTFSRRLARCREHFSRIVPYGSLATARAFDLVHIRFHQFVKAFPARRAFVLQKRHIRSRPYLLFSPFIIPFPSTFSKRFSFIKSLSLAKIRRKSPARPRLGVLSRRSAPQPLYWRTYTSYNTLLVPPSTVSPRYSFAMRPA